MANFELVERGRAMARSIQGNLARRIYRLKDAEDLQDASDLLWGLANVLEDYIEAASYWQRMYEETVESTGPQPDGLPEQVAVATLDDSDVVAFAKRIELAAKNREPLTLFGVNYKACDEGDA